LRATFTVGLAGELAFEDERYGAPLSELSVEQERFAVFSAYAAAHAQRHWFVVDFGKRAGQHIGVDLGPSGARNVVTLAGLALRLVVVELNGGF